MNMGEESFLAKETTGAKVLRKQCAWHFTSSAGRPEWLEKSKVKSETRLERWGAEDRVPLRSHRAYCLWGGFPFLFSMISDAIG